MAQAQPFLLAAENSPSFYLSSSKPSLASKQDEHGYRCCMLQHHTTTYHCYDALVNELNVDVNLKTRMERHVSSSLRLLKWPNA